MSHFISYSLLFLSLFFVSCDNEIVDLKPGLEFQLKAGKLYEIGDYVFEIKDVVDSRCPVGVNCIWEGEAVIKFDCKRNDEEKISFLMDTQDDTVYVISHFKLILLEVSPLPDKDQDIKREDFRVRVSLEELSQR